jgi:hypothetical protein
MRILLPLLFAWSLAAEPLSPRLERDLLDSLYRAEGGPRARRPYGILSRPVVSHDHARSIAAHAIRGQWYAWERAGRPVTFPRWFARTWCPPRTDPRGHRNLVSNLETLLRAANRRAATR